jgi:hypothetical protein
MRGKTHDRLEMAVALRWAAVVVCLLAAGCSSPYANFLGSGTPAAQQVGAGIVRIALSQQLANCGTPDECTLVKAAEAARQVGGTHFMVLPGHGGATQPGYAYIRVFTLDPGDVVPSGAMSVEEALQFFNKPRPQLAAG